MNKDKYDDYRNYIKGLKNEYAAAFEKIEVYINGSSKLNFSEKNNCFFKYCFNSYIFNLNKFSSMGFDENYR